MTHALQRTPVDVCRLRCEERVVLGNAGVVRVLRTGGAVTHVREGDRCVLLPVGQLDGHGYVLRVFGYDAPRTVGMLARVMKARQHQLCPIAADTAWPLPRWAAFSVRYFTAWDNWRVALGCYRLQMSEAESPAPHVWGCGGGVAFAELLLARAQGCRTALIASRDARLRLIEAAGIAPVDRRPFLDLDLDENRLERDPEYRARYLAAEREFLRTVRERTANERVAIFIENIGAPVYRATLRALARQGVITTTGWGDGRPMSLRRVEECIGRHIHVHTHAARYNDGQAAVDYAERNGWLPPMNGGVHRWEDVPQLAEAFAAGEVDSYFPVFEVNGSAGDAADLRNGDAAGRPAA